jgi:DNA-binding Lrp family transcriptional regulator
MLFHYRISPDIIPIINRKKVLRELAGSLDITEQSVLRHMRKNEVNGLLTTMAALQSILSVTNLHQADLLVKIEVKREENLPVVIVEKIQAE